MTRRRRIRRRRWWLPLLVVLCGAVVGWPKVEQQEVFRVRVVHLVGCPDHLRQAAYETLSPSLGQTFFEVLRESRRLTAALTALPEVATADLRCRPPHFVELSVTPRVPQYALPASGGWLQVDGTGVIVRVTPSPPASLTRLHGLVAPDPRPGSRLRGPAWLAATAARAAADVVLGRPPHTVAVDPGPTVRLRSADRGLVILGSPIGLERKLRIYQAVCNRLDEPALYVDVSVPEAPAWVPAR